MNIALCTRPDFLEILAHQQEFWGSDRALAVHHPMMLEEFGDTAWVIRDAGKLCAYLFGFLARDYFYIHLVAVRDSHKGRGLARQLYSHAEGTARAAGAKRLKAITPPFNARSIAFHRALGFEPHGPAVHDGVPCVADYSGPGRPMVILLKTL